MKPDLTTIKRERVETLGRSVPEWIGATDDQVPPDRVKLRIWRRYNGRCAITGKVIRPGDPRQYDHILALCNDGENRESNLQLVSVEGHKVKTRADIDERVRTDRMAKKHAGIWPKGKGWNRNLKRTMAGQVVRRNP